LANGELRADRRDRQEAAKQRAKLRREFLLKKVDAYSKFCTLEVFARKIERVIIKDGGEPLNRLAVDLNLLVDESRRQFERQSLNAEITNLKLFTDEDFVGRHETPIDSDGAPD